MFVNVRLINYVSLTNIIYGAKIHQKLPMNKQIPTTLQKEERKIFEAKEEKDLDKLKKDPSETSKKFGEAAILLGLKLFLLTNKNK